MPEGSPAEAWDRVRRRLRAELGEDVFSSWFARVELGAVVDGVAYLTVPDALPEELARGALHRAPAGQLRRRARPATAGVVLSVRQVARDVSREPRGGAGAALRRQPQPARRAAVAAGPSRASSRARPRPATREVSSTSAARCSTGA